MAELGVKAIKTIATGGDEAVTVPGPGLLQHRRRTGDRQPRRTVWTASPAPRARRSAGAEQVMMTTTTSAPGQGGAAAAELARRSHTPAQRLQHLLHSYPAVSPLPSSSLTVVVFTIINPRFATANSLSLLVQQTAVIGALAIGQTLVILTAGIDLSVGAITILSAMVMATLAANGTLPGYLALAVGIAVATAAGLAQRVPGDPAQPATVHRHPGHAEHLHRAGAAVLRRRRASRTTGCRTSQLDLRTASPSARSRITTGVLLDDPHVPGRRLRAEPDRLGPARLRGR